jgi:hypothetical protein
MNSRSTLQLSKLREIGWQHWDPLGLRGSEHTSPDEYDTFLIHAAGRLWDGAAEQDVTDYLLKAETDSMAINVAPESRRRARLVVAALSAYVSRCRR